MPLELCYSSLRYDHIHSPKSLDTALCEAVRRGWWWGASKLVAAGASAHAAYKTTVRMKQVEVTRCVCVCMCVHNSVYMYV